MIRKQREPEKQKPQRGESRQGFEVVNNSEVIHVENHSTNVIPFKFDQRQVRTLLIDGEPWFVAADICGSIGIANVSLAVNGRADREGDGLDIDERGIATVNTPSGDQEMLIVNESGLYSLIFKSRKAEARRFKKWVTSEVLPAIRKYGRYEDEIGKMTTLIGQTIGTDGFHMLGALIKGKVTSLNGASKRRASGKIWSQLHAAFGVRSAQDIPAEQLDSARNFVAAYAIEGEWLPSQQPEAKLLDINWPAQRWINEANHGTRDKMTFAQGKGHLNIMASMLIEQGRVKPTLDVLKHLEQKGYNVEACKLELAALVHHLSDAHEMLANYRRMASWSEGRGIRFKMEQASA